MIIRHFMRHRHRARTLNYVLGRDLLPGTVDPRSPQILLGDPDLFAAMSEKWSPYSMSHYSGVLSLSEMIDRPCAKQLAEEFFDVLLPGRRVGQCMTLAVLHSERGRNGPRSGIHVFALASDLLHPHRKLEIYWPARGDKRRLEIWQELVCIREGFSSPKEGSRKREIRWGVSPRVPGADEMLDRFRRKLAGLSAAQYEDTEEFACRVALAGGVGVHFDQTHRGRLRARFSVQHGGQSLRLSAISHDPRASPLRKSALRDSIDAQGYRRSPEFLRTLKDRLIAEIDHAADRREPKHGVNQARLLALRVKVAATRMPSVHIANVRDETDFGFPKFEAPVVEPKPTTPSRDGPSFLFWN